MKTVASFSVLVACLCLVAGSPIPEDALPISFAVTTTAPSTSQDSLLQKHENLSSVCVSMLPAHNAQPQNSVAPYTVTLSKTKVAPGGVVAVEFSGVGEQQFRGLYVQARTPQDEPVGQFLPSDDEHVRLSNCSNSQNNAISYISYQPKPRFTFQWLAPDEPTTATFTATIVETYSKLWVAAKFDSVVVEK